MQQTNESIIQSAHTHNVRLLITHKKSDRFYALCNVEQYIFYPFHACNIECNLHFFSYALFSMHILLRSALHILHLNGHG